jgi:hypothetical protein
MICGSSIEHLQRRDAGGRDGGRVGRREEERPRAVVQEVDQVPVAGDVAAEGPDRLRQRPDLDVHPPVHPEVIDRPAAAGPEDAAGMCVVHHHDAAGLLGDVAEFRQRAEIAVHAEDAVGDEQLALAGRQRARDLPRRVHVLVREYLDRGTAQAATVDDARVVEFVRDDHVVLGQDGRHRAGVGGEATLKDDDRLDLLELGEALLEFHVDGHGARNGPHRARADAEPLDGLERPRAQLRVSGQPEVVVRRKVDDRTVVEGRVSLLRLLEDAQAAKEVLLPQAVDLLPQVGKRVCTHEVSIFLTLWGAGG